MRDDLPDQSASGGVGPGPFDRSFWLVILIASAVIVPRSVLIAQAHSESFDDGYHLTRGLAYAVARRTSLLSRAPDAEVRRSDSPKSRNGATQRTSDLVAGPRPVTGGRPRVSSVGDGKDGWSTCALQFTAL